jgi:Tol biopolymer transport system component
VRALCWLVLVCLAAVPSTACGALQFVTRAEAVDVQPPSAQRSSQPVRAQGRILYVADGRVWEWADGATRPLTPGGQHLEGASWSPDGKSFVASDVGENHSDVYTFAADGSRLRQLTHHWSHVSVQDSAWGRKPAWSPSGEQIAYVSDLYRTDMSLWIVAAGGGNPRQVYRMPLGGGGLDWPSWSPDGKKIAFTSYPGGVYQPPQVFVLTLATGAVAQLTELKSGAFDPAWSPDGALIAFSGRVDNKTHLMVMRADGKDVLQLTDGQFDRAPAWSPDGSEIAYLSAGAGAFDLWAIHVGNGTASDPKQLTSGKDVDAVSGVSWTQ